MPVAEIKKVKIYYEDEGQGEPLVLIHGFSSNLRSWDEQMPVLLAKYRVVRYDCRGHGRSQSPADPAAYSQEILVEELLGLLDKLALDKVYACGLSMGGNVALHLAMNHPHRVKAIIMVCTGSGSMEEDGFVERFKAIADVLEEGELERFADAMLSAPPFEQFVKLRPDLIELHRRWLLQNNAVGLANTIRGVQMKRPSIMSLEERLTKLEAPALILVGEEDMPCMGPAKFMREYIPRSRLVVFPQTGHIVNLERTEDFNREAMDFLKAVEAGEI